MNTKSHFIDLSIAVTAQTPVYPGDPFVDIQVAGTYEKEGYWGHQITLGNHAGTHIDAPAHMIKGAPTLDAFGPEEFVGNCCYIDVRNGYSLEAVQQAQPQAGDIVVFDTGMAAHFNEPTYFTDFPVMNLDIAEYLVACGVKMVGLDTCSADNSPGFAIHKKLLGSNILIIENLTNIAALKGVSATIYALPIKLSLDAAPARVIAEIKG